MSIKEALAAYIKADVGVVAAIGQRFYPDNVAEGSVMPCAFYSRQSAQRERDFCGTYKHVNSAFQIDTFARTVIEAQAAADAIRLALVDFRGQWSGVNIGQVDIDNEFDLLDPEPGLYRVSMTFTVWHEE